MAKKEKIDISKIFEEGTLIDKAVNEALRDAIKKHKQMGVPMVVWENGRTVMLSPEEMEKRLNKAQST